MAALTRWMIFFFMFHLALFARVSVNTLEKKLNSVSQEEKPDLFIQLAHACWKEAFFEKCILYGHQALDLCRRQGDIKEEISVLTLLSGSYLRSNNEKKALKYIRETINVCQENGEEAMLASLFQLVGSIYQVDLDKPVKAIKYFAKANKLYEKLQNQYNIAYSTNNLGAAYFHISQYDQAMDFYLLALKLFKNLNEEKRVANTLNNIGMVYSKMGDYERALEFYRESLQIREKLGTKQPIGASLNNIGILYSYLKQYPKALDFFYGFSQAHYRVTGCF
jgi:tetratricopeptide (TPR) repeat protein